MCAEPDGDFFLCAAMEWAEIARGGRTTTISTMYRELAYCHLLFKRGRYAAVLARVRLVCGLSSAISTKRTRPPDRAETLAVAADLLETLKFRLGHDPTMVDSPTRLRQPT